MVGTVRSFAKLAPLVCGAAMIVLAAPAAAPAQTAAIEALKGKIFDAHMAQQTFADGLRFCAELDGKSFYFQVRKRVLNLEEYFQALENLVKAQVFNPDKRRPWTAEDAKERWDAVKKQALEDQRKCELVQELPELEKQLQELQKNAAAADKKE